MEGVNISVRGVEPEVYEEIKKQADVDMRSINGQILMILKAWAIGKRLEQRIDEEGV